MGKLNRRKTPKYGSYEEVITSHGEEYCFVCDKKFKPKQPRICVKWGKEGLYRHERCDCMSEIWKKKFKYVDRSLGGNNETHPRGYD